MTRERATFPKTPRVMNLENLQFLHPHSPHLTQVGNPGWVLQQQLEGAPYKRHMGL